MTQPFAFTDAQWKAYQQIPDQGYSHRLHIEHVVNEWRAAHDRVVAAQAWDEGFNAGHYIGSEPRDCECKTNPYRITEENN